jgi:predicted kinase
MDSYFHEIRFDDLVVPKREVLMMVGNVGSGKSFQAERLKELKNAIVISRDSMRFGIGAGEYIFNNDYEPIIKKTALEMFQKFLTFGCNIIIDEVNIAKTSREPYIKVAHAAGYQIRAFVMPKLSKEESMARKTQKSYNQDMKVWETVWENFDNRYEEPTLGEGFDELIYHKEINHGDN